jgi:hypothetical protein
VPLANVPGKRRPSSVFVNVGSASDPGCDLWRLQDKSRNVPGFQAFQDEEEPPGLS